MAQGETGSCHFQRLASLRERWRLPSGASYCCRIGVNVVFMAAFDIPVTAYTVALVAASHMLSGLFAITPGGVGQTQALDVATLGRHAPTENVAAFSVAQDSVLMIWNVVLGVALMLWAFGYQGQAAALEHTPEAGAGARLHVNESSSRPCRPPLGGRKRGLTKGIPVCVLERDRYGHILPEDELVRAELDEAPEASHRTRADRRHPCLRRCHGRGVRVRTAAHRGLHGDVWDEIRKLSWQWLVVLGLATLLNLATYGPPLMAALPGLSYFRASRVTLASTALSVVAPRRRRGWHGDNGRDAARARLQWPPRRARRRGHEHGTSR